MGANVRPFSTTTTRRVASLLPTTISPRPKELGTSPRREDSTGRSAKRSAAGSVSPRHRDDALVLRAQFSVGDRVEYRRAQASKLRRALDDPLDREVTARPFRAEPVTAVYRPEPSASSPRESKEPRRPRDLSTERRSPRDRRSEDPLERAMEKTEVQVRPYLDAAWHQQCPRDGAVVGWAANAGREMASRAGAVTVRRMVQTTKLLLQNLETALMLRAGFLANCYHRWHLEVQFAKLDAHHREELEQHHDAWAAHFKNHQLSFEEELAKHARHQMTAKEKRQQQAMLIDAWAQWNVYRGWVEGKSKGLKHSCFLSWHHQAQSESLVRQKEAELASAKGSFEKDKAAQDAAFMRKLQEIESKRRDNTSGVEAVLASWAKGKSKGSMALVWKHWITWSKEKRNRWAIHRRGWRVWLRWRHEAQQRRTALQAQKAVESEAKKLEKLLDDERRRAAALEKQNAMSAEQRKEAAKRLMQYVAAKWEYGDKKGTLKGIMKGWCSYVLDAKRHSRRRQGVHDAVLKSLLGEARGSAKLALMNWHSLTKDEKRMRQMEDVERKANERLDNFMKDGKCAECAECGKCL
eukprot:g9009.t1